MRIKFLIHNGKEALHRYLVEVIIKIADYIFSDSEKTKKGVDRAMGGEVLELKTDKLINEIRQDVKEEVKAEVKEEVKTETKEKNSNLYAEKRQKYIGRNRCRYTDAD